MDANNIDEVLTENGLGIRRNTFLGMSKEDFSNLSNLLPVKNGKAVTDQEMKNQALAIREIRNKTQEIKNFAEGRGFYNENKLVKEDILKSPEYPSELASLNTHINIINSTPDADLTKESLDKLDEIVFNMQSKYGINKTQGMITLVDTMSKNEFKIAISDLKTLDGMQDKSLIDIINEGKVTVKENNLKIKPAKYEIKMQLDAGPVKFRNNFIQKEMHEGIQQFVNEAPVHLSGKNFSVQDIKAGMTNILK
jgi:hypothetical protein